MSRSAKCFYGEVFRTCVIRLLTPCGWPGIRGQALTQRKLNKVKQIRIVRLILILMILLIGSTLQAQEDFFAPVTIGKVPIKTNQHEFIDIIHGPGQIRFNMPLGPGIGVRGLSYQPQVLVHPVQRTTSGLSGGANFGAVFLSGFQRYTMTGSASNAGPNTVWYNCNGATTIEPVANGTAPVSYFANSFNQDITSYHQIDVGYLIHSAENFSQKDSNIIILPNGDTRETLHGISNSIVNASAYKQAIEQFGYSFSDVTTFNSMKSNTGGILFPLLGKNGQNISTFNYGGNGEAEPGRLLYIDGSLAYEYEFLAVNTGTTEPAEYDIDGNQIRPSIYNATQYLYRLIKSSNRFGDYLIFSYGQNGFDVSIELYINGGSSGKKIAIALSTSGSIGSIPNLMSYWYNNKYINADRLIKVTTSDNGNTVSSYSIRAAITPDVNVVFNINNDKNYQTDRWHVQPVEIEEDLTHALVKLSYKWTDGYLPYAQGIAVGCVVISDIEFRNNEKFEFDYSSSLYHAAGLHVDWEPMTWGVSSVRHIDIAENVTRTSHYTRKIPIAKNIIENGCTNARQWISKDFYETEELPGGRFVVRKFFPPLESISADQDDIWGLNEKELSKHGLYSRGTLFEETIFSSSSDWQPGAVSENNLAMSMTYWDQWDSASSTSVSGHPFGYCPGEYGNLALLTEVSHLYPTRMTTWNKSTGVAIVSRKKNWDAKSFKWKEEQHTIAQVSSSPWSTFELSYSNFSDNINGIADSMPILPGQIVRSSVTTYQPLNGNLVFDDWSQKDFLENGATRLPSVFRASNPKNGVTISEEKRASDDRHIRKEYLYDTDNIGVPSKVSLASDGQFGTDGTVGVLLGYDGLYRLNRVQKLGASYASTRELNADNTNRSITDINNFTYSYSWDSLSRFTGEIRPNSELGITIDYHDDSLSQTLFHGAQEGSSFFNAFGELVRTTRKDTPSHSSNRKFGYDPAGRKIWESTWLDGFGSNQGWNQPLSGVGSQWSYDLYDRVVSQIDPNGIITTASYQDLTTTRTIAPGTEQATITVQVYDIMGRLVKVVDALNQVTTYDYDSADRIIAVRQYSTSTGVGSSAVGSGAIQTRNWVYDGLGHLTVLDQPESGVTYFSAFTVTGKPTKSVYGLPRGWRPKSFSTPDLSASSVPGAKTISTNYDTQSRITSLHSSDGSVNQNFTYDEPNHGASNGRLTSAATNDIVRTLGYGGLNGRLSDLNYTFSGLSLFTQNCTYDSYGNLAFRKLPDGSVQATSYNPTLGLPNGASYNGSGFVTLSYDPVHWGLGGITYTNGSSSFFGYDPDQVRLNRVTYKQGSSILKDWIYSYDAQSRLLSDSEDYYGYDPLGRLAALLVRDFNPAGSTANSSNAIGQLISYDAFGNRLSLDSKAVLNWPVGANPPNSPSWVTTPTSKGQTFAFSAGVTALSARNQLPPVTSSGVSTGAMYDDQGNLTQIYAAIGGQNKQISMTYDALGRVKTTTDAARSIVEVYYYDDRGLRVLTEIYQTSVAPQNFLKKIVRIYNEVNQLASEYEWVLE